MRIRGLDFLRGIAIIGVLCRHSEMQNVITRVGGFGVDLFFVLSGFLVASLLFTEYQKTGSKNIGRFLIRRGFKIIPVFYVCLGLTILIDIFYFNRTPTIWNILTEAFFLQSYGVPMRFHTWSLSVEEHFYMILAFLVFLAVKFKWLNYTKSVIDFLGAVITLIFTMRLIFCLHHIENPVNFFATHLSADGLFTGVLLSYLWHFKASVI